MATSETKPDSDDFELLVESEMKDVVPSRTNFIDTGKDYWRKQLIVHADVIRTLGQLMLLTSEQDVQLVGDPKNDSSLQVALLKVVHEVQDTFLVTHENVNSMRILCERMEDHIKNTLEYIEDGDSEDIQEGLPLETEAIKDCAKDCGNSLNSICEKFKSSKQLFEQFSKNCVSTKETNSGLVKKLELDIAKAEKNRYFLEKRGEELKERVEKTEEEYKKYVIEYLEEVNKTPGLLKIAVASVFSSRGTMTQKTKKVTDTKKEHMKLERDVVERLHNKWNAILKIDKEDNHQAESNVESQKSTEATDPDGSKTTKQTNNEFEDLEKEIQKLKKSEIRNEIQDVCDKMKKYYKNDKKLKEEETSITVGIESLKKKLGPAESTEESETTSEGAMANYLTQMNEKKEAKKKEMEEARADLDNIRTEIQKREEEIHREKVTKDTCDQEKLTAEGTIKVLEDASRQLEILISSWLGARTFLSDLYNVFDNKLSKDLELFIGRTNKSMTRIMRKQMLDYSAKSLETLEGLLNFANIYYEVSRNHLMPNLTKIGNLTFCDKKDHEAIMYTSQTQLDVTKAAIEKAFSE